MGRECGALGGTGGPLTPGGHVKNSFGTRGPRLGTRPLPRVCVCVYDNVVVFNPQRSNKCVFKASAVTRGGMVLWGWGGVGGGWRRLSLARLPGCLLEEKKRAEI